jgi:hypothetical protein
VGFHEHGCGDRAARVEDPLAPPHAEAELGPPARRTWAASSPGGPLAVYRVLRRQLRRGRISPTSYRAYVNTFRRARAVRHGLSGARGSELGYVIGTLERIALGGRLIPSRMPELFLILRRNTEYSPSRPYPGPVLACAPAGGSARAQFRLRLGPGDARLALPPL